MGVLVAKTQCLVWFGALVQKTMLAVEECWPVEVLTPRVVVVLPSKVVPNGSLAYVHCTNRVAGCSGPSIAANPVDWVVLLRELGQKEACIHLGLAHVLQVEVKASPRSSSPAGSGEQGLSEEQARQELGAAASPFHPHIPKTQDSAW